MSKYSVVTTELANIYPTWSRVRFDRQSLGQRFLNSAACSLERAQKEMIRTTNNFHLTTANLDEIDWIYRVDLPASFTFNELGDDVFDVVYDAPTVSGLIDGTYYSTPATEQNNIESFWYNHLPDRISEGTTVSGSHIILDDTVDNAPFSGLLDAYIPNKLYVDLSGGIEYVSINDNKELERAQVSIEGTTRKGTKESEIVVFPWDQTQQTFKEWDELDKINCAYMPEGAAIKVYSGNFDNGPYIDFWNIAYSPYRKKIDIFWDVGSISTGSTLEMKQYTTDEIKHLLDGVFSIYVERSFELFDQSDNSVTIADISQQPFTDYVWAADDNKLYCYNMDQPPIVENPSIFDDVTPGAKVYFEFGSDYTVRTEEVDIDIYSTEPTNAVYKYRTWVEYPDTTRSGILGGELVSYYTESVAKSRYEKRIDQRLSFSSSQLGEHVFNLEVLMRDGTTQLTKRVLRVDYKTPVAQFDLPSSITRVYGIDFSSDQDLWIWHSGGYTQINLHHDVMLVDYDGRALYFREPYSEVLVWS